MSFRRYALIADISYACRLMPFSPAALL